MSQPTRRQTQGCKSCSQPCQSFDDAAKAPTPERCCQGERRRELANWYLIEYHCGMTTLADPQVAAALLRSTRITAGLSLRVLAARAGTSHATLSAYERGRKLPSISTYVRVLEACGNAVDLQLQPRVRERDGIARGEELASVLALAAQFPAKVSRHLKRPVFPHG